MTDWEGLLRQHGPKVYGVAWRILGHAGDAEDVVQDVFLEVHRLWSQRPVRQWAGLLHSLASCRSLDRLRQRKKTYELNGHSLISPGEGPEEEAIGRELTSRLRAAIAQLPQREAKVFCLRYFEDLPYQEIADSLRISRGAVAAALHKARAKLETLLTPVYKGDHL